MAREPRNQEARRVGLCFDCRHAGRQESKRGSSFWRCLRADEDAAFRRYPPLPVVRCAGFEEGRRKGGSGEG